MEEIFLFFVICVYNSKLLKRVEEMLKKGLSVFNALNMLRSMRESVAWSEVKYWMTQNA